MSAMSRRIIIVSVVTGLVVVGGAAGGFAFVAHGEQVHLDKDARVDIGRSESTTGEGVAERSDPTRTTRVDQDPPGLSC